ncbi:MAG: type III-B CRISPR module RAMP protein Cmr6 [Thermodesulfobacterium sp.]|nr:type III-B CRISPR module RAMP protein Cmr6 [Thermodesulfobacterium sp.]
MKFSKKQHNGVINFNFLLPSKLQEVFNIPSKGFLPTTKKEALLKYFKEEFVQKLPFSNFALLWGKYIPIIQANIIKNGRRTPLFPQTIGSESRFWFLDGIVKTFVWGKFKIKIGNTENSIFSLCQKKSEELAKNLEKQGYKCIFNKCFTTFSRLIVGLGAEHPLETSITLHHIFGIPYIPGSALKGVCRVVAFWSLAKEIGVTEDEAELKSFQEKFYGELAKDEPEILKYQLLFGAKNFKGLFLFLDAYPEIPKDGKLFDLDVMNVHYKNYYSGNEPPADWQNPNPIFFLTVRKDIPFNFYVFFDQYRFEKLKKEKSELADKLEIENIVSEIEKLLKQALQEFGIGAKTSLGYGIFE